MIDFKDDIFNISSDKVNKDLLEYQQLLEEGWIEESSNGISLKLEDYILLDSSSRIALGFPSEFSGGIKVLLEGGGINLPDARIKIEFFARNNEGSLDRANGELKNGLILCNGIEYSLQPHHFELIELINVFNDPNSKNDRYASFIQFGRIAKLKNNDDVFFDSYLEQQEVIVPSQIKIKVDVDEEAEEVTISPEIEGVSPESFASGFDRRPRVSPDYRVKDEGKTKRIFISGEEDGIKSELEIIKNQSTYSGEEIVKIIESPNDIFNLELTDIEELLSERVLGLSAFLPPTFAIVNQKGSEWIPGFQVDEEYVLVSDKIEYLALKNLLIQAIEIGDKYLLFKGKKIKLDIARSIEKIAKLIFEDKNPPTEEDLNNSDVLIVKDNIEEVEFAADFGLFEKLNSTSIIPVNNLKSNFKLKDHQVVGVSWLQEVKNKLKSTGALLADDMGLGKTLQILYFLESIYQNEELIKPSLIVAPSSLLENWKSEYELFFKNPSLKFEIVSREKFPQLESERENPTRTLYLTTYETMRINALRFCTIDWAIVALDEAQKIKNPSALVTHTSKGIKADFKIAMTGTPVENTFLDLWSIMDFCTPGLLGSAKGFNKGLTSGVLKSDEIRDKIEPVFIRRLKSDVAKDLPEKREFFLEEEMPAKQFDIYNQLINQLAFLRETDQLTKTALLRSIHELRLASDHPELILDELVNEGVDFNSSAKMVLTEKLLKDIQSKNEKVIIFTDRRKMQILLKLFCQEKFGIDTSVINGDVPSTAKLNQTVKTRQGLVNEFQAKEGFNIIIMSPVAAGFGLNVVGANNVIHYTRHWNPAKEQQATDRVYRIGQTKDVNIYYPMAVLPDDRKSFDEILDAKLAGKKALADDLLFPTEQIQVTNEDILKELL